MSIAAAVKDRCTKCQVEFHDRLGYEGMNGETLCGQCYFAIWGVSGAAEISAAVELLTPDHTASPRRWGR